MGWRMRAISSFTIIKTVTELTASVILSASLCQCHIVCITVSVSHIVSITVSITVSVSQSHCQHHCVHVSHNVSITVSITVSVSITLSTSLSQWQVLVLLQSHSQALVVVSVSVSENWSKGCAFSLMKRIYWARVPRSPHKCKSLSLGCGGSKWG